jgi:hypothetical protein
VPRSLLNHFQKRSTMVQPTAAAASVGLIGLVGGLQAVREDLETKNKQKTNLKLDVGFQGTVAVQNKVPLYVVNNC